MAKNRAIEKQIPFNLDIDFLMSLWKETNGCCAITGQKFDLEQWGNKGQVSPQAVSIDRIKPQLGYIKGNVRLITYHLNIAISDFGLEELEKLCKFILNKEVS